MARRTKEEGLRLALEYQQSGMTQIEFAKSRQVTLSSIQYWTQKSQRPDRKSEFSQNQFVEIRPVESKPSFCGKLWIQTPKVAMQFEQLPQAQYLVQLLNGIHIE